MTAQSQKILDEMQVRKTGKQKEKFRAWLCGELKQAGYEIVEERGGLGCRNIVAGDPERAAVLLTAHYDTQPALPFPNFITPRNLPVYILYQLLFLALLFLMATAIGVAAAMLGMAVEAPRILSYAVSLFFGGWVYFGKANRHTANDNTSGVVTLLETALSLPAEDRNKCCFVFFDNEEKGLLGSSAFVKKHKEARKKALVLNFDCVSDGDYIHFFPSGDLKKEGAVLQSLEQVFLPRKGKAVEVVRSFCFYPSDNIQFRRSCGVCALKKNRWVYYMDRIHTERDVIFEEENIALLRDGILKLLQTIPGEYLRQTKYAQKEL